MRRRPTTKNSSTLFFSTLSLSVSIPLSLSLSLSLYTYIYIPFSKFHSLPLALLPSDRFSADRRLLARPLRKALFINARKTAQYTTAADRHTVEVPTSRACAVMKKQSPTSNSHNIITIFGSYQSCIIEYYGDNDDNNIIYTFCSANITLEESSSGRLPALRLDLSEKNPINYIHPTSQPQPTFIRMSFALAVI